MPDEFDHNWCVYNDEEATKRAQEIREENARRSAQALFTLMHRVFGNTWKENLRGWIGEYDNEREDGGNR